MGGQSDKLLVVNTNKIIDGAKAVAQFVHAGKRDVSQCKKYL